MSDQSTKSETSREQSFIKWLLSLDAKRLGNIALNLCALSWIGLNIGYFQGGLNYSPGCYVSPNWINILSAGILIFGSVLAALSIKRGNILMGTIALTFTWSFVATLVRTAFEQLH